jgi:hypothetical protein
MPKPRTTETREARSARLKQEAQKHLENASDNDDAIDAMIQRNIPLHGACGRRGRAASRRPVTATRTRSASS